MGYIQYFCTYQRDGSSGGFQCVDTLVFASKHAEGMSLRCDVICALAYCDGHESSHIIKAHTDSTRFNEKIIRENLC